MIVEAKFSLYAKFISNEKGYGVFTRDFIKQNSIVETCYVIPSNLEEWKDFLFGLNTFLPSGFGCIYNHSDLPNIAWQLSSKDYIVNFIATKDIEIGQELCHNYGNQYWKTRTNKKVL